MSSLMLENLYSFFRSFPGFELDLDPSLKPNEELTA